MNNRIFEILDYFKIILLLEKEIFTSSGKQHLMKLQPSSNLSKVQQWLKETTEMKEIIKQEGKLPFIPLTDVESDIKQTTIKGRILSPQKLLLIAKVLECLNIIKEFFNNISAENYPLISKQISVLKVFRSLEKEIRRCINEEAEIVDNASPELKKIRIKIRSTENKIRDRLEHIIRDPQNRTYIQDDIVTIRQGRYVIPIKQQAKSKFPGIVHDKSESGVTVFIEPLPVVDYNNELRELYQEEEKEEYRILQYLAGLIGQNGNDILDSYYNLGYIDLVHAKSVLSLQMKAVEPFINKDYALRLIQARHPLLRKNVVPISIEIGRNFDVLVITGPNTGGKTVTLKTAGLLQLMAQSGLHIPAGLDSEVAIFENIFADIGDEQSMEQNLSTFSSHMNQTIQIIKKSDERTLVLLDELGAGTDPSEGSALGMAILDFLRKKRVKVLSTTHHDSLKAYAYLTDRVMNARVEFDEKTLQPTYEISIGLPGKSCAFSVAKRLGLPTEIIKDAQQYLKKEKLELENLIKKMERDRAKIVSNLECSEKERAKITELKKELELKIKSFEKEKTRLMLETYQEADEIISNTQKRARQIIQAIKNKKPKKEEKFREDDDNLTALKQETKKNLEKYEISQKEEEFLEAGDHVLIKSLNKKGFILKANTKKGRYQIQVDNIKLTIPRGDIQRIDEDDLGEKEELDNKETYITSNYFSNRDRLDKKANFKNEINIRQMNKSDAQIQLEKYLDDAFLLNVSPVYIIHGKGKGILRKKVTSLLNQLSYVKSYRQGDSHEGGSGVTVVYF